MDGPLHMMACSRSMLWTAVCMMCAGVAAGSGLPGVECRPYGACCARAVQASRENRRSGKSGGGHMPLMPLLPRHTPPTPPRTPHTLDTLHSLTPLNFPYHHAIIPSYPEWNRGPYNALGLSEWNRGPPAGTLRAGALRLQPRCPIP